MTKEPTEAQVWHSRYTAAQAEIERLLAETQVWINHTKTAVWSDSEECKLLTEENAKLRAALERIAELPVGYADMNPDHVIEVLTHKARAALGGDT